MLKIKRAMSSDLPFLTQMLHEAANWRDDQGAHINLNDPHISRYISDWGRPGDVALVAVGEKQQPIGAAWYRFFTADEHGYGFIASDIPEITLAVIRDARGRGVGGVLLETLFKVARENGVKALSLSVEEDNPAVRLYKCYGFKKVDVSRGALTMRLNL